MRKFIILGLAFLATIFFSTHIASATEGEDLQLSTYPNSLELSVGEESDVFLTAHNLTDQTLSVNSIQALPSKGLTITIQPEIGSELLPYGDHIWSVQIKCDSEIENNQLVYLRLDYQNGETNRSVFVPLTVNPIQPLAIDQVASLDINASAESLSQQRNGWVYLSVTNQSNQPIKVKPVQANGPDFITFGKLPQGSVELLAHDSLVIPIELEVSNAVQPGNYLLIYEIPITQEQQGVVRYYDLVQKQTVTVGVLGESELLSVFQIPSLLLLPGMLSVITIGLLYTLFGKNGQNEEFPLKFKNEAFWLVSITISIFIAWIYPKFTELVLKNRRDYLYGYGIEDIAIIWCIGIGIGLISPLVWVGVRRLSDWIKVNVQRSLIPTREDDPQTLLQKLDRQGLKIGLEKFNVKDGRQMFLLQKKGGAKDSYWMCHEQLTISYPQDNDDLGQKIVEQMKLDGDPKVLLELAKEGNVTFGQMSPPEAIKSSEIENQLERQVFVMIKVGRN